MLNLVRVYNQRNSYFSDVKASLAPTQLSWLVRSSVKLSVGVSGPSRPLTMGCQTYSEWFAQQELSNDQCDIF